MRREIRWEGGMGSGGGGGVKEENKKIGKKSKSCGVGFLKRVCASDEYSILSERNVKSYFKI